MYDRFQQLVFDAQLSVAVFGNPAAGDFALVAIAPPPAPDVRHLSDWGYQFIGVVGRVDGAPRIELAVALDSECMDAVARASLAHLAEMAAKLPAVPAHAANAPEPRRDDFEVFAWRLFSLQDTRTPASA